MIIYDRNAWFKISTSYKGTVLPATLTRVAMITALSLVLHILKEILPKEYSLPNLDPLGHTVLGSTIGLLIVFRTNSSNARYWEARSNWGMLINSARSLARMGHVYAGGKASDLAELISAYVIAVKQNLRNDTDLEEISHLVPGKLFEQASRAGNAPTILARAISEWIFARYAEAKLDIRIANNMEQILAKMVDSQGGCEKILKTPLPFVYAALIKQTLMIYLFTLPFVLVERMGLAGPLIVAVVSLGMLGIEEAGVETEAPFATDANDLPLEQFCLTIVRDTHQVTSDK
jgi:putative membrane protein